MGAVMDTGTADADTITDGKEAAVTTNGATIAAGKGFAPFASVIPIALTKREWQRCERSRPQSAAGSAIRMIDSAGAQPSPISTAIRIRSE
jgi:hypothetical protein